MSGAKNLGPVTPEAAVSIGEYRRRGLQRLPPQVRQIVLQAEKDGATSMWPSDSVMSVIVMGRFDGAYCGELIARGFTIHTDIPPGTHPEVTAWAWPAKITPPS